MKFSETFRGVTFTEGDLVEIKDYCSGAFDGHTYFLETDEDENGNLTLITVGEDGENLCSCIDNWILISKIDRNPQVKMILQNLKI
jgi:hypothetical protein